MTYRVKQQLGAVLLLCLWMPAVGATEESAPDIDLLEFLGTIAGLEGMGVEIDELLAGPASDENTEIDAGTETNEGESDE